MKKAIVSLCLLFSATILIAQNTISQKYQYTIPGKIEMIEKMPGGIVLVGTSEGLSGLEAHTDKVIFNYTKMGKIKAEEMTVIPNTAYITLTRGYSKVILDYTTGQEVYSAASNGWAAIMSVTPDASNNTVVLMFAEYRTVINASLSRNVTSTSFSTNRVSKSWHFVTSLSDK